MLLEDEHGTINLIVPPAVYERHRLAVRTEPLVVADGRARELRLGGRGGQHPRAARSRRSTRPGARSPTCARWRRPTSATASGEQREGETAAAVGAGFRAVAPPVMSFAQGRRR